MAMLHSGEEIDVSHPLYDEYELLPSGCRDIIVAHVQKYFIHSSMALLRKSWKEKDFPKGQ